jgi:hypothetical protein
MGRRQRGQIFGWSDPTDSSAYAIEIVLANQNDRELPGTRHIARFVKRSSIGCPIANEGHRYLIGPPDLGRAIRGSHGDGHPSSDDAVPAEHTNRHVSNVQRAAFSFATTGLFAVQLRHQAIDIAALRKHVAMAAMTAYDVVICSQDRASTDSHRLLANIEVNNAR